MKNLKLKIVLVALLLSATYVTEAMANIVVRAIVVNPSAGQKRRVPFRSYLPKEVKLENIIDKGDLDVAYDPKEGSYYVYKDYVLEPSETVSIEIELEDVWRIPAEEIELLRQDSEKLVKTLSNTDYYDRAMYLKNSIESKLNQIEYTQTVTNPSPGGHISDYRENMKLIESIKADVALANSLVVEAKSIAPMVTWKLIVAIAVFLGVLGLIFFIIWQRQIKSMPELAEDYSAKPDISPEAGSAHEEGEKRQAQEDKKSQISDIEERLKEKPE